MSEEFQIHEGQAYNTGDDHSILPQIEPRIAFRAKFEQAVRNIGKRPIFQRLANFLLFYRTTLHTTTTDPSFKLFLKMGPSSVSIRLATRIGKKHSTFTRELEYSNRRAYVFVKISRPQLR